MIWILALTLILLTATVIDLHSHFAFSALNVFDFWANFPDTSVLFAFTGVICQELFLFLILFANNFVIYRWTIADCLWLSWVGQYRGW